MFKSSENLRLAAEMRALQRVAAPWREARTSWFDGTPESIAARLAATERVLSYAKAGMTEAHFALEREASAARSELLAAQHRLLTDFLDDGARAFKGSKRVAGPLPPWHDDNPYSDDPIKRHLEKLNDDDPYFYGEGDEDGEYDDPDPRHYASRTAAGAGLTGGDHWRDEAYYNDYLADDPHADADAEDLRELRRIRREEHPDLYPELDDPARYSHRLGGGIDLSDLDPTSSAASLRRHDDKQNNRFTLQKPGDKYGPRARVLVNHDDTEMMSPDGQHHWASRVAFDIDPSDWEDLHELQQQHEFENRLDPGSHREGDFDECPTCHETTSPETLELARRYKQSK